MVDYLFLIPLTPSANLNGDRRALQELCFAAIKKLQCSYQVYLLGELEDCPPNFKSINLPYHTKEDKLYAIAKELVEMQIPVARYLVRLDDDDLINAAVFDQLTTQQFDVAYDSFHHFYDLSSGQTSQQKRHWIANTAIHKYTEALSSVRAIGGSKLAGAENWLIACDHSGAWHTYYADKIKLEMAKNQALYLRILSPETRTAIEAGNYQKYLSQFGNWNARFPLGNELREKLKAIWLKSHHELRPLRLPKPNLLRRFRNFFKSKDA